MLRISTVCHHTGFMAQRFRIIDGYNLMHSVGYAREQYGQGGLERSRTRLLRFLVNRLDQDERRRTTVVFDARAIPFEGVREYKYHELTVLFNPAGSDADTLIEELILEHSAPKQLEVVSGDRRLQKAIKRRKGIAVESEVFARLMRDRESIVPGSPQDVEPQPVRSVESDDIARSDIDTEFWLTEFGEINTATPPEVTRLVNEPKKTFSSWEAHVKELIDDLESDVTGTDSSQVTDNNSR